MKENEKNQFFSESNVWYHVNCLSHIYAKFYNKKKNHISPINKMFTSVNSVTVNSRKIFLQSTKSKTVNCKEQKNLKSKLDIREIITLCVM